MSPHGIQHIIGVRAESNCPPQGGVAIGFDPTKLKQRAEAGGWRLRACIYDAAEQHRILDGWLTHCRRRFAGIGKLEIEKLEERREELVSPLMSDILAVAPVFKNAAFSEEAEWRLIAGPMLLSNNAVRFHPAGSLIVPYLGFLLAESVNAVPITRVIVGPSPHPEEMAASIVACLMQAGLTAEVISSACPYRAW